MNKGIALIFYKKLAVDRQRFLDSPRCCKEKIWWGIWMEIMAGYWQIKEPIVLAIDRTSWRKYHLLVVSWIIQGRAIPVNWQLLDKLGSSNHNGFNLELTQLNGSRFDAWF